MEFRRIDVLVLVIGIFFSAPLIGAQSQAGFISLDCGLPSNGNYAKDNGIYYISDENFTDTGVSMSISSSATVDGEPELSNVRSFPQGSRNCYNLPLKKGDKYLIRARFFYGNYDNKGQAPQFDLYIGPNKWTTVTIDINQFFDTRYELIHVLTSNNLQICLVTSGTTTPFISALELRPLSIDAYNSSQSGSLGMWPLNPYPVGSTGRYLMSTNSSVSVNGYPDDIHDRTWSSDPIDLLNWVQTSASQSIDTNNDYDVPQLAVQNAAVQKNSSENFVYSWSGDEDSPKYQVFLHFAEVQTLKANEYREFNITFNGNYFYGPFSPRKFKADTIFSPQPFYTTDFLGYNIGFQKTSRSTLPPILNAIEIYRVVELPQQGTAEVDFNAIMDIRAIYGLKQLNWEGDPCLPQDANFLWHGVNCSYDNTNPPRITILNLPASGLKGQIAKSIFNLSQLTQLDLSDNNLTGEVPEFLAKMNSLTKINLSGNQLSGSVPQDLIKKQKNGTLELNVDGNPLLCQQESCNKSRRHIAAPIVASVASLVVVIAIAVTFLIISKKKQRSSRGSAVPPNKQVTYSDIINITNNFEKVIGRGGFGSVYHGYLNDTPVAVKVLSPTSIQGYRQFMAEVELLLKVHHRNLVSLAGYCSEGENLALIYEYMANGDLNNYLSGGHGGSVLSWANRLLISREAAQGLEYLHNGCKPPMIHRDVKSTNILLDKNFQAKLSDFGLSRSFPTGGESHVSTVVAGTPGYVEPEYVQTNRLTEKSDVYSFGIVLLEIITNQPVIDNKRRESHISEWTRQMLQSGDINHIVDPQLQGDFDVNSIWKFIELAMACVDPSSTGRPTMHDVVMELNECLAMELARTQKSSRTGTDSFSLQLATSTAAALMPAPR